MSLLDRIAGWWRRPWIGGDAAEAADGPLVFPQVEILAKTPPSEAVEAGRFLVVKHKGDPYWAMFRCPCGCESVISLPLRPPHQPRWRFGADRIGRPTLTPSVWRNSGCRSHFWIEHGRVRWCGDSGRDPYTERPDLYVPRRTTGPDGRGRS
jgi:hypothetical protein